MQKQLLLVLLLGLLAACQPDTAPVESELEEDTSLTTEIDDIPIDDDPLRGYPYRRDISTFEVVERETFEGGDCEGITTRYRKGNTVILVDTSNCFDYGRSVTTLLVVDGRLRQVQEIGYGYKADPERQYSSPRRQETIYDFAPAGAMQYERNEPSSKTFSASGGAEFTSARMENEAAVREAYSHRITTPQPGTGAAPTANDL